MASVRVYLVGLVVLAVVAVVFAVLWSMAYTGYTSLETRYAKLQSQYKALEANCTILEANYTTLRSQYNTLEANYNKLTTALTSAESYSGVYYLNPGNGVMFDFIVPKGYIATVNIDISSSDSLAVAIAPLNAFNEYEEGLITSWTQAPGVTFYMGYSISKSTTLSPGSYFIAVVCSSANEFGANVYVNITTTLTPTS